jgi:fructose-bisphosphate aldolase, class I
MQGLPQTSPVARTRRAGSLQMNYRAEKENPYMEEMKATAKKIAGRGRGILASDESNATTGKRLDTVGVANTEDNRRKWRELLYTAPGLGQYISGAIMFEETLYQSTASGKPFVDVLVSFGGMVGRALCILGGRAAVSGCLIGC